MKKRGSGRIVLVSSQAGQTGVFGFSAYSASKFALVGFAQALRMELKPYGVNVSVAYPPDTDTPGYEIENRIKPEETRIISETSGLFQSEDVASGIISGIRSGDFSIYCGLDGWMLANLCAGMSPASSILEGLTQVVIAGPLRLIAMVYTAHFDRIALGGKKKRQSTDKKAD
jgi:3-dehydrosphinganine reductase